MRTLYTLLGGFALFAASLHGQVPKPPAQSDASGALTKEIALTAGHPRELRPDSLPESYQRVRTRPSIRGRQILNIHQRLSWAVDAEFLDGEARRAVCAAR